MYEAIGEELVDRVSMLAITALQRGVTFSIELEWILDTLKFGHNLISERNLPGRRSQESGLETASEDSTEDNIAKDGHDYRK